MSGIQISGLLANSAFDWKSIVDQLIEIGKVPITKLETEKTANDAEAAALASIGTALSELQDAVQQIRETDSFAARTVASDLAATTWKCSSVTGAPTGSYAFDVTQLATEARLQGAPNIGGGLRGSSNVANLTAIALGQLPVSPALAAVSVPGAALEDLPFDPSVQDGSFTINGVAVNVAASDSLQEVLSRISTATSGAVTGSYDAATDKLTLNGVTDLSGDTSNFVSAFKLVDEGGGVYASSDAVGAANAGTLTVNGSKLIVKLTDSLDDIFAAIADATGNTVIGAYDSATDKITFSGVTSLGDVGDTSNFVAALKLADCGGGLYRSSGATGVANAVADLTLASVNTATAITAGTFTVGGQQITVETTDSLQDVFDAIASATGGAVTARYNAATDKVTLVKGTGELVLGAGNDTSNFLAVMKLVNNGTSATSSAASLGCFQATDYLVDANLRAPITAVDGSGNGSFSINGVAISYNLNTDTLRSVVEKINAAGAGVTADYNAANDQVMLVNDSTGDTGISVTESAGGLLAALGLSAAGGGTFVHGDNALFSINGGETLTSTSNTLDESIHGIAGLSVTVNTETTQTLQVESDTATMQSSIESFIAKFNAVQDLVESSTKIEVSGTKVSAAVLSGNQDVESWATQLRALAFNAVSGLSGTITRLSHIGIDFEGTTGHLAVRNTGKLATALGDQPEKVRSLFLSPTEGIVPRLYSFLTTVSSADRKQQSGLSTANKSLDEQIATLQRRLDAQREQMTNSFMKMLDAQSVAQSQNTYLTNAFFKEKSN